MTSSHNLEKPDTALQHYFDLFDNAPVGYCILSVAGSILEANRAVSALLGIHRQALLNAPFSRFIHKEDQEDYLAHWKLHPSRTPLRDELRLVRSDNSTVNVLLASVDATRADGTREIRVTITDITAVKQEKEALYAREVQWRRILQTIRDGIAVTDKDWNLTFVSHHAAAMLGYTPQEIAGQPIGRFLFSDDTHYFAQHMREREQGLDGYYECRFQCKDGRHIWASVSATAQLDRNGSFAGSFIVLSNITGRKRAEASSKAKSDFLALVSHEIRTPLNSMVGFSALARKTKDLSVLQEYLDVIDQSSRSLMDLVNDLLDMSKIETGQMSLESIPFNLVNTLDLLIWQHEPLAAQKNLVFQLIKKTDLPDWIAGDPIRLRQILNNLVANAIKFTASGRVVVEVTAASAPNDESTSLQFAVTDTGIGIPESQLSTLFQPFQQLDPSVTRVYGGTGLGLAIVKNLVQLMGGCIEVKSQVGRGSCFVVALPFRRCKPPEYKVLAPSITEPRSILVVEDNTFNRQFLANILMKWGHTVTQAENGFQALELASLHRYDCILLDVRMPEMDGIELTRRVRQNEKERDLAPVPIIACTADTEGTLTARCLAAGMKKVLFKPINLDELVQIVGRANEPEAVAAEASSLSSCLKNQLLDDMGHQTERIEEFIKLLREDVFAALQRLDQSLLRDDRQAFKDAAHTLKGLCGHLSENGPRGIALQMQQEAFRASQDALRDMASLLRSACTLLLNEE